MAEKNKGPAAGVTEEKVKILIVDSIKQLLTVDAVTQLLKEAGFIVSSEDRVKELVAEGYEGTVKLIEEAIRVIPNEDRIRELIGESFQPGQFATAELLPYNAAAEKPPLDPDWLEGLVFKGSRRGKAVKGQPKPDFVPFERPLEEGDVLSYAVGENTVTLISADGHKYTVEI